MVFSSELSELVARQYRALVRQLAGLAPEADAVALRRQSRAAAPSIPARHAERSPERLAA